MSADSGETRKARIAVVDYGMGNLRSVEKALEHLGANVSVTSDPSAIASAAGILLPGVGALGDAARELDSRGLSGPVRERAVEATEGGRPFLGVCVGLQLLMTEGEEGPDVRALNVIPGGVPRLRLPRGMKVPHMGWNQLEIARPHLPFFGGVQPGAHVYFVHSYHCVPEDASLVAATADYGGPVTAVVAKGNLVATQFHPEKSQRVGMRMLENFVRLVAGQA